MTSHRRPLGVESFEDRVLPSAPGFSPGGPPPPPWHTAIARTIEPTSGWPAAPTRDGRDWGSGPGPDRPLFGSRPGEPGSGGPSVGLHESVVAVVAQVATPTAVETPTRGDAIIRATTANPASSVTPTGPRALMTTEAAGEPAHLTAPAAQVTAGVVAAVAAAASAALPPEARQVLASPPPVAPVGFTPQPGGAAPAGPADPRPAPGGSPTLPAVPAVPPDDARPIEVDPPPGMPVAGVLAIDPAAVEAAARQVLDRVSAVAAGLSDVDDAADGYTWFAAGAVLAGGAGAALWMNRRARRLGRAPIASGSVIARWGEEHDARLG